MKKATLLAATLLLAGFIFANYPQYDTAQTKDEMRLTQSDLGYIAIDLGNSEVYDDGAFRKLFNCYTIYNSEKTEMILYVSESFDSPSLIKIKEGEYYIKPCNNSSLFYKVKVEAGKSHEYELRQ